MNTECLRIADQLHRAFYGEAWHGPSLREVLTGATAERASNHPAGHAHSIWELVLHIRTWTNAGVQAAGGVPVPASVNDLPPEQDWPPVKEKTEAEWKAALEQLFETAKELEGIVRSSNDAWLLETVPGRKYNFYFLFHGIVQHSLYHAGQIALLKKSSS